MNGDKIYGLIGRTLGHSWSLPIHHALGCPSYRLIELKETELEAFLKREDIGGLNVTIPYKKAVMPYCDSVDADAAAVGSVNTLVRGGDGKLRAWNTDVLGFRVMAERAGISFAGRKVVILGSGGASLSVRAVVREAQAREVVVISRNGENHYGNLSRHADADILVNTTPVGMYPDNGSAPLDLTVFPALRGVLDVIYNPRRTALLLQAESLGIPCSDGLPMLVAQAAGSESLFFGSPVREDAQARVLAQLRRDRTNVVLIGMPGSGKSAVGRALSVLTGREAVETDERIEKRAGKSIPEIFASEGEAAFRTLEREEVEKAGKETGKIIVTGGGVVKDMRNYAPLRQNGRIYHVLRDVSALPVDGRPLSQASTPARLWEERKPLYERFRDTAIDNRGTVQDAAQTIWRDFCAHSGDERS